MSFAAPAAVAAPQSRLIDGVTYTLTPLPAWHALEVLQGLLKVAGPLIGGAAAGGDAGAKSFGAAFQTNPAEVAALLRRLLEPAQYAGARGPEPLLPVFDVHFQGRLLSMFKLAAFAVEVNFGDFFAELRRRAPAALSKIEGAIANWGGGQSASPNAGSSGA